MTQRRLTTTPGKISLDVRSEDLGRFSRGTKRTPSKREFSEGSGIVNSKVPASTIFVFTTISTCMNQTLPRRR